MTPPDPTNPSPDVEAAIERLPDSRKPNLGLGHTSNCERFETHFPWQCDCQVRAFHAAIEQLEKAAKLSIEDDAFEASQAFDGDRSDLMESAVLVVKSATVLSLIAAYRTQTPDLTFQARVEPWMRECFGDVIPFDKVERGDRLLEEVFELLQSGGYDPARVAALRDYTWNRPAGEPSQEVGGVMVTLAAYCLAFGLDMHAAGETELARIWTKVDQIRAKQAAKPTGSALPIATQTPGYEIGKSNREAVRTYFLNHVGVTNRECGRALGLSEMAVGRHVKTLREEWNARPSPPTDGAECTASHRFGK